MKVSRNEFCDKHWRSCMTLELVHLSHIGYSRYARPQAYDASAAFSCAGAPAVIGCGLVRVRWCWALVASAPCFVFSGSSASQDAICLHALVN